jgi:hypothetical protein
VNADNATALTSDASTGNAPLIRRLSVPDRLLPAWILVALVYVALAARRLVPDHRRPAMVPLVVKATAS